MKHLLLISFTMSFSVLFFGCDKPNEGSSPHSSYQDSLKAEAVKLEAQAEQYRKAAEEAKRKLGGQASKPETKTETEQKADSLLAQQMTPCGESWIGKLRFVSGLGATTTYVLEARGVSYFIDSYTVSDADHLNGIEWNGEIRVHAKAIRLYVPADATENPTERFSIFSNREKGWSKWITVPYIVICNLSKKEGRWQISKPSYTPDLGYISPLIEPISCDQLPQ